MAVSAGILLFCLLSYNSSSGEANLCSGVDDDDDDGNSDELAWAEESFMVGSVL